MTEQINEIMEKIKNDPIIQQIKEKIDRIRERNAERVVKKGIK